MQVAQKGNNLVITIPMNANPTTVSKTGKTLSVASSNGNKETEIEVQGRKVIVGVNAYIYANPK